MQKHAYRCVYVSILRMCENIQQHLGLVRLTEDHAHCSNARFSDDLAHPDEVDHQPDVPPEQDGQHNERGRRESQEAADDDPQLAGMVRGVCSCPTGSTVECRLRGTSLVYVSIHLSPLQFEACKAKNVHHSHPA